MTLELILNHHYYRMIESGNKDEEYRRMCNHWKNRIWKNRDKITAVRFHKGYTSENMTFKVNSIRVGIGDESLGAPTDEKVYIVSLGERIDTAEQANEINKDCFLSVLHDDEENGNSDNN